MGGGASQASKKPATAAAASSRGQSNKQSQPPRAASTTPGKTAKSNTSPSKPAPSHKASAPAKPKPHAEDKVVMMGDGVVSPRTPRNHTQAQNSSPVIIKSPATQMYLEEEDDLEEENIGSGMTRKQKREAYARKQSVGRLVDNRGVSVPEASSPQLQVVKQAVPASKLVVRQDSEMSDMDTTFI